MVEPLKGKSVLITGGAAGIGRATAMAFARREARLVIADVDEERGRATAEEINGTGGEAAFLRVDVSNQADVKRMVEHCVSLYGRLDCAFNNAGIEGDQASTADCSQENWHRVLAVNLTGLWLCMKHEIPQMLKQGGGAIVNMSSVAGLVGFPGLPAYVASKHGIIGITRTAALEYATKGIRVNAICPGVIRTEMVERVTGGDPEIEKQFTALEPIGRMGDPEEVAETVVWLCSSEASFVIGHPLVIDGGFVAA